MNQDVQALFREVDSVVIKAQREISWNYQHLGVHAPFYLKTSRDIRRLVKQACKSTGESRRSLKQAFAKQIEQELHKRGYDWLKVTFTRRSLDFSQT